MTQSGDIAFLPSKKDHIHNSSELYTLKFVHHDLFLAYELKSGVDSKVVSMDDANAVLVDYKKEKKYLEEMPAGPAPPYCPPLSPTCPQSPACLLMPCVL